MELITNIERVLESLSTKFPTIEDELPLYLLASIARQHYIALNFFDLFNRKILEEIEKYVFSETTLLELKEEKRNPTSFIKKERLYHQKLCNFLIQNYLHSNKSSRNGYDYEPQFIIKCLIDLAQPKPKQIIYNPNCGIGSIFVELYKSFPKCDFKFIGHADYKMGFLCELNLFANDVKSSYKIIPFNPLKFESELEIEIEDHAELAITIPPFNGHISVVEYIEIMLAVLNENGKAFVVVPEGFLVNAESKKFRDYLLSADWIEKIISLPKNTFTPNTFIKTSIIVINKNKLRKGFVVFDGKDDGFEETHISINVVKSQKNLDLRAFRYASRESKELTSILSTYPQDEVKKINDAIVSLISGRNYSPKDRIVENSPETLPYVRVKDLSNNDTDFTLDISKVERKISLEKVTRKKTIIDFSVVLVSKIAPKLKPTYFDFTGQPIVIGSDVIALKLKENIDVEYFLTQLHSRLVRIQVENMSSGATINRIGTEDFLNIQIILPPLDEQKRQVSEMRGLIAEKITAEEKLIDAQFDIVASINHSLKNKLAVIVNDYDSLVRFLRRKERNNGTISFADPISVNAVGDDIDTIEIITTRLKNNLSNASKVFNNALKIQRQNLKKDFIELVDFFKNEVKPLYAGKNYSIDIVAKPKLKLNVWLDKDAFKDVIENLIDNAKSHGFIDESKNYQIVFDLSKLENEEDIDDTSTQYARILYKNDGKPFPKDYSFEEYKQYLSKAGKTQGTGFGGYAVNKLIELHDGRFNFITPSDDFTVEFEILLPLEN